MKGIGWIVILLILCLSGFGLFIWQYSRAKKIESEVLEKVKIEVAAVISQRDSIEAAKTITLEELKLNQKNLAALIKQLESIKKDSISVEDAKKKLWSI